MYEFLEGKVERQAPTSLVINVGGVGYFLAVPLGSRFEGQPPVRVWTHQVVREDAQTLYGFANMEQRDLFRLLLSVRGVGPAVALMLLSGLSPEQLVEIIMTENREALTRVKGVGKKTADQLLLDLRDKVTRIAGDHAFTDLGTNSPAAPQETRVADAVSALVSIGYKEKEALKLVEKTAKKNADLDVEHLIRAVLGG
ncbi:MAG: Holliday junction DNA helicase RuvA [Planctomycetota bacterium]